MFLRAYRALRGYDAARIREMRTRPWLLTILRNTARNAARDAARRPGPPPAFEPPEPAITGPGVEQRVEDALMQREWGRLLGLLPEAQRVAVVLRHVEDLPTREIADILGCREGTAKSHVSRGLQPPARAARGGRREHDRPRGGVPMTGRSRGGRAGHFAPHRATWSGRQAVRRVADRTQQARRGVRGVHPGRCAVRALLGVARRRRGGVRLRPTGGASPGHCAPSTAPLQACSPALRGGRGAAPPLDLGGLSAFERSVLAATSTIPAG